MCNYNQVTWRGGGVNTTQVAFPCRSPGSKSFSCGFFSLSSYKLIFSYIDVYLLNWKEKPFFFLQELVGTQVLIPVVGGLIELFSANHVRLV